LHGIVAAGSHCAGVTDRNAVYPIYVVNMSATGKDTMEPPRLHKFMNVGFAAKADIDVQ
jgi:hypothetical protein